MKRLKKMAQFENVVTKYMALTYICHAYQERQRE
jgi:hypothetical protein